jgi:FkbM family methyltransferase
MNNNKEVLLNLFEQSYMYNNSKNTVNELIGKKNVILYGAGHGSITFLSHTNISRFKLNIQAILDQRFTGEDNYCGIPAFSPLKYTPTEEDKKDAIVIITVGKSEYHPKIFDCLNKLGFRNVILSSDIYEYNAPFPLPELEKEGFNYYLNNKNRIIECFDFFTDDLSREIFTRFMQTHMQKTFTKMPRHPLEQQYFPEDIILNKGYSRFVCCGAYNGDTIAQLNNLKGKVNAIACFEPDPNNFKLLTQYLRNKQNQLAENVFAFPLGVFSDEKQLYFLSGNFSSSAISDTGESIIQCAAIDHVIPDFKPTFITMDVEGAELEAIKGVETLIRENKPDLAISVYHLPNHIWDIPLYIDSLKLGYKFYLRNYTSSLYDTVLYATVQKSANK